MISLSHKRNPVTIVLRNRIVIFLLVESPTSALDIRDWHLFRAETKNSDWHLFRAETKNSGWQLPTRKREIEINSSHFSPQPSAFSPHYAVRPQAPMQLVVPIAVSAAVRMLITT